MDYSRKTLEAQILLTAADKTGRAFAEVSKKMSAIDKRAREVDQAISSRFKKRVAATAKVASGVAATVGTAGMIQAADDQRNLGRIANKIEATTSQMEKLKSLANEISDEYSIAYGEVISAIDALGEAGRELPEVVQQIGMIMKAAQAAGVPATDLVRTVDALQKSLKLDASDIPKALEYIIASGAAGKFEVKDAARLIPAIAPVARTAGLEGLEGVKRLIGELSAIRDVTGNSEQAANAFRDFYTKIFTPGVQKRFEKQGIDIPSELEKGKAIGEAISATMSRLIRQSTEGDAKNLPKYFTEIDSLNLARLLHDDLKSVQDRTAKVAEAAPGITDRYLERILGDTKSSLDRAGNLLSRLTRDVGELAAPTVNSVLGLVADMAEVSNRNVKAAELVEKNGLDQEAMERAVWEKIGERDLTMMQNAKSAFGYELARMIVAEWQKKGDPSADIGLVAEAYLDKHKYKRKVGPKPEAYETDFKKAERARRDLFRSQNGMIDNSLALGLARSEAYDRHPEEEPKTAPHIFVRSEERPAESEVVSRVEAEPLKVDETSLSAAREEISNAGDIAGQKIKDAATPAGDMIGTAAAQGILAAARAAGDAIGTVAAAKISQAAKSAVAHAKPSGNLGTTFVDAGKAKK